jgi:CHASE3 domain sensor protein
MCPHVGPFSPPQAIREWQAELAQLRREHADDPQALECVERNEQLARTFLE